MSKKTDKVAQAAAALATAEAEALAEATADEAQASEAPPHATASLPAGVVRGQLPASVFKVSEITSTEETPEEAAEAQRQIDAEAAQQAADALNAQQIQDQEAAEQARLAAWAADDQARKDANKPLVAPDAATQLQADSVGHQVVASMTAEPSLVLFSDGRQGIVLDEEGHFKALNQYTSADVTYLAVRVVYTPPSTLPQGPPLPPKATSVLVPAANPVG